MANDDLHFMRGETLALFDAAGNEVGLGDTVEDCDRVKWTVGGVDAVLTTDGEMILLSVLLARSSSRYSARQIPTYHGTIPQHFKA